MPRRIQIGTSDRLRSEYLENLKKAYQDRRLVIFLGAGVSFPYKIPTWKDLVSDILINRSDESYEHFFVRYRKALASWLADEFEFSPTLLARVVRYQIDNSNGIVETRLKNEEYRRVVKEALYRTFIPDPDVRNETTLSAIARIISENENNPKGRAFPAIVSFNFDDLLEKMLRDRGIKVESVYKNARISGRKFPIVHVNGYLPNDNNSKLDSELVFTEDEFNRLTFSQLHWAVSELTSYLRNYTVLFIGLSMADPNLRRLLDGTCINRSNPSHFLIRKDYKLSESDMERARREIERRAQQNERETGEGGLDEIKSDISLTRAIEEMLNKAHRYDRRLFKDMGVGTLWINDHDDIPAILDYITSPR